MSHTIIKHEIVQCVDNNTKHDDSTTKMPLNIDDEVDINGLSIEVINSDTEKTKTNKSGFIICPNCRGTGTVTKMRMIPCYVCDIYSAPYKSRENSNSSWTFESHKLNSFGGLEKPVCCPRCHNNRFFPVPTEVKCYKCNGRKTVFIK